MSNTVVLRIQSDELNNSTDRLTESETLMRSELMKIYLCSGAREQGVLMVMQHPLFFSVGNCKLL